MLGCLIFSVTRTNNLIGSFVPPHTPNGHAGLLNRPPPLVAAAHTEAVQCHWHCGPID
jgi:hypothetical protein